MFFYSEEENYATHYSIVKDSHAMISKNGLILISGGLDKCIKIWDFNISTG